VHPDLSDRFIADIILCTNVGPICFYDEVSDMKYNNNTSFLAIIFERR
jgi:hypothetical protein